MTWHQQQRPSKLYHETRWAVVIDPPGALCWMVLCDTQTEALQVAQQTGGRIAPPAQITGP